MRSFVFLILLTSSIFCDAVGISSYEELKSFAARHYSTLAVLEFNRSLAEVRLHHPGYIPAQDSIEDIVFELKEKGYFDPDVFYDYSLNPVKITSSGFDSIQYPALKSTDFTLPDKISPRLLKRAVLDQEDPYSRLLALEIMEKIPKEPLPILPLIRALESENHPFFLARFARVLKKPLWYGALQKESRRKTSKSFSESLIKLHKTANDRHKKAVLFFFSLALTKIRPEPEIPVLMTLIDEHYPIEFLIKTFKQYPPDLIETFAEPFEKGYGNKFDTLVKLFSHFPKNRIILKALYQGLIHRNEGHFQMIEGQLIKTWAKITKIPWSGSDQPYKDWYASQFNRR